MSASGSSDAPSDQTATLSDIADEAAFDCAVAQIDAANRRAFQHARMQEIRARETLRVPPGAQYPFNAPEHTLEAAVSAASRATNREAPAFRLDSDPDAIYSWMANAILGFGTEMREEGRTLERESVGIPLSRRNAERAFELMTPLTELLSNRTV